MNILRIGALCVALLGAIGCGKNEAVEAAEKMADSVCACNDFECAQRATSDGTEKLMKLAESTRGTEADAKKILAASERAADCLQRFAAAP